MLMHVRVCVCVCEREREREGRRERRGEERDRPSPPSALSLCLRRLCPGTEVSLGLSPCVIPRLRLTLWVPPSLILTANFIPLSPLHLSLHLTAPLLSPSSSFSGPPSPSSWIFPDVPMFDCLTPRVSCPPPLRLCLLPFLLISGARVHTRVCVRVCACLSMTAPSRLGLLPLPLPAPDPLELPGGTAWRLVFPPGPPGCHLTPPEAPTEEPSHPHICPKYETWSPRGLPGWGSSSPLSPLPAPRTVSPPADAVPERLSAGSSPFLTGPPHLSLGCLCGSPRICCHWGSEITPPPVLKPCWKNKANFQAWPRPAAASPVLCLSLSLFLSLSLSLSPLTTAPCAQALRSAWPAGPPSPHSFSVICLANSSSFPRALLCLSSGALGPFGGRLFPCLSLWSPQMCHSRLRWA